MTLTDLLPVRRSVFDRGPRAARKHRSADDCQRLRFLLDGANALIKGLRLALTEEEDLHQAAAEKQAAAEELVVQQQADIEALTAEVDVWRDDALALRARFGPQIAAEANANRVDVPQMVRPVDGPEDQATGPIDVKTLWEAHGIGPTSAVTDPGQVPAT